jgi:hypothetical protein
MCEADDAFENVAQRLREETKSIVDDIIGIVRKAEDNGREMKEPKGRIKENNEKHSFCLI